MLQAQPGLQPGFDPAEYADLLRINFSINKDTPLATFALGKQHRYHIVYRSPELGLKNMFEIWLRDDRVALLSIRGTVPHPSSWMENFYSAMVPATGMIQVSPDTAFTYTLSEDPQATVHAGWTVGLAHMAPLMVQQVSKLMQEQQVSQLIVAGHSQGGALTFLTTSYFYYLSRDGRLPGKLAIKAYCSAAPKPGNMFYAYDFDYITRNGMGFNVVNAADWVPETPPSVQTFSDINPVNPFYNAHTLLGKMKWPANWYLNGVYKKLKKSPGKTAGRYQKYFGHKVYGQVRKFLPRLEEPAYASSFNYMRAGIPIILKPDSAYFQQFPQDNNRVFIHHMLEPYLLLLEQTYGTEKKP
jgi:hypothetical protein